MLRSIRFRDLAHWRRRASLLLICSLACFASATAAETATRTFKTVPADGFWSNPANWEEGIVPVNGDDLVFPHTLGPSVLTNTIANLQVRSLAMAATKTINGQPFSIGEGGMKWAGNGNGAQVTFNVPVTMMADQTWPTMNMFLIFANQFSLNGHKLTFDSAGSEAA